MNEEVHRLEANDMIMEVHYPDWLANVMVMKKKNGKNKFALISLIWTKQCPNDSFPLLMIDKLVNAIVGHEMMSFFDAFLSYNLILMHLDK